MSKKQGQGKRIKNNAAGRNSAASSDESLSLLFPSRALPSISNVESFAKLRRASGLLAESSSDDLIATKSTIDAQKSNTRLNIPKLTVRTSSDQSIIQRTRSQAAVSGVTSSGRRSSGEKRKRRKLAEANILSDLDVQTSRPPMLHKINFIELLWLHNIGSRLSILLGTLILCFFIGHLIAAISFFFTEEHPDNPNICETQECINLGNRIKRTLNRSVNPCEDFYAFVCGSSEIKHNLPPQEEDYWDYGNNGGRLDYDFDRSVGLGRMLVHADKFPHNLALTFYQACLQVDEREKLGVEPFYDLLKKLNLFNINKSMRLTKEHVIDSMAKILSYSMYFSAMLFVHYYKDPLDYKIKSYITPSSNPSYSNAFLYRYGYQLYFDTIKNAFTHLDKLGLSGPELDIVAHDIICLELHLRDLYVSKTKTVLQEAFSPDDEDSNQRPECEVGETYTGTSPKANFGNPGNGDFDYELLIKSMYAVANPDWNPATDQIHSDYDHLKPQDDSRTDATFKVTFEKLFKISAPIRLLRYLQWRVLVSSSLDLNDKITSIMIHITRHEYLGPTQNCFHAVFRGLPFLASDAFLEANKDIGTDDMDVEFQEHAKLVKSAYERMILGSNFTHVRNLSPKEIKLLHAILLSYLRIENVPPTAFRAEHYPSYPYLYEGLSLNKSTHFLNLVEAGYRVHQWKANPRFAGTFFDLHPVFHEPIYISIDLPRSIYDGHKYYWNIYAPIASAEAPFLHNGLAVADASGIQGVITEPNQKALVVSMEREFGVPFLSRALAPDYTTAEITAAIKELKAYRSFIDPLVIRSLKRWKLGELTFENLKYDTSKRRILNGIMNDISRYQVLSAMIAEYLNNPANSRQAKYDLKGIEEFDALQLFYITLVGRKCEKFGKKKFDHISKYGPLPQTVRNNVVISNLDGFSRAFNCPVDSPMNPAKKIYLWDRYLNITEVNNTYPVDLQDLDLEPYIALERPY